MAVLSPLQLYGTSLMAQRSNAREDWPALRLSNGRLASLALGRWLAPADATDQRLLDEVHQGPVLDVGCGPGRHLHALARRGVFALGVDISAAAVALARDGGGHAIVGSIFDEAPGAGSWRTALLLDGNIGIGGQPKRLLRRIGALLCDGGETLIELDPPGTGIETLAVRLETARAVSRWFPWARVGVDDIDGVADAAGLSVAGRCFPIGDRWFARLARATAATDRHVFPPRVPAPYAAPECS